MSKYYKSFEELKLALVSHDGNPVDLIDNDEDATEDYSRRSRFGRNPESNVSEFQQKQHSNFNYDDWLIVVVCSKSHH